jgi:hypothetical protein
VAAHAEPIQGHLDDAVVAQHGFGPDVFGTGRMMVMARSKSVRGTVKVTSVRPLPRRWCSE